MAGNHAVINKFLTRIGIDLEMRNALYGQGMDDLEDLRYLMDKYYEQTYRIIRRSARPMETPCLTLLSTISKKY
jgi:hypothetical protein